MTKSRNIMTSPHLILNKAAAPPTLYASVETRAFLGAAALYLPQWACMDVMVVTSAEIATEQARLKAQYSQPETMRHFAKTIGYDLVLSHFWPGNESDKNRDLWNIVPDIEKDDFVAKICIGHDVPFAYPMIGKSPAQRNLCVIKTETPPDMELLFKTIGLGGRLAFESNSHDIMCFFMAHEAAHSRHPYKIPALNAEIDADRKALRAIKSLRAEGHVESPMMEEEVVAWRYIQTINHQTPEYATGPYLRGSFRRAHGPIAHTPRMVEAVQSITERVNSVSEKIRATGQPEPTPYMAVSALDRARAFADDPVQKNYVDEYLRAYKRYIRPYHFA